MRDVIFRQSIRERVKIVASLLMAVALIASILPISVFAQDTIGTRITLEKIDGEVSIVKSNSKKAKATAGVKLSASEKLRTEKASYAYISVDDDKVIKLDELTEVNVKKSGNKLSVVVSEGNIFFEVKEKLESNESMNLNAASMAMSIRGTSGIIGVRRVGDNIISSAEIIEGSVDISYSDVSGKDYEFILNGGEECSHTDGSDEVDTQEINLEEFPGFAAVELIENEELCEKIAADNKLDYKWLIDHAEELLETEQKYNSENYSDVFEEGSKSSVASKQKDRPAQINKFLKSFWGETTGLVPERAGMITPTPLPSQAPVNTITITPKPTQVASENGSSNGNNNENSDNGNVGQGSTTIIVSGGDGTPPVGSVSQNTVPPAILGAVPTQAPTVTQTSSPSQEPTGPTEEELRQARLQQFLRNLAAYRAYTWLMSMLSNDEEEVDNTPTYTVTYIGKDGETVLMTQQVKEGDTAVPPEAPYISGYIFNYWGGMLTNVNSDRKIYAVYSAQKYKVTFYDPKSENPTSPYYVEEVMPNEYATAPASPYHEGYLFTGWKTGTDQGGSSIENTQITNNTNFYANYEENEEPKKLCIVRFVGFDGEILKTLEVESGYVITESDVPTMPEIKGYNQRFWNTDPYDFTVKEDTYFEVVYIGNE